MTESILNNISFNDLTSTAENNKNFGVGLYDPNEGILTEFIDFLKASFKSHIAPFNFRQLDQNQIEDKYLTEVNHLTSVTTFRALNNYQLPSTTANDYYIADYDITEVEEQLFKASQHYGW